ncbi:HNH endonuclease [Runella sp.]|uniref:HNH endonuclease n=1 Tax=Runella sp. TaxID=1960881 RepID=UPI003D0BBCCC
MRSFYIKKLGSQELGSPKADGSVSRGRYLYITKAYHDFFPFLSKTVTNDNVLIPIIPPFSNTKIYSTFVYHNDKYNVYGGTRDEFRLYLNKNLDPGRSYFHVNDILVFEKIETETPIPVYILYRFNSTEAFYNDLSAIIASSSIKGEHALFTGELHYIPQRKVNIDETVVVIPEEVMKVAVEQQNEVLASEEQNIEDIRGASLFRSDSFRDFVLHAYNYKCAITGKVIRHKNLLNLEAAHIQPKAQAGTFLPCNGIALCRDMHWAFDKGLITLSDDLKIIVHEEMKDSELMEYNGKKIFTPVDPYFQPEKKFLNHHREKIFGLFLFSGSIRSE